MDRSEVRVLLLDDEPFVLQLHAHLLRKAGFSAIRSFEAGGEALATIDAGRTPDLIMLDLSMPEMDGIEFIRHLGERSYPGTFILVSSEDERLRQTAERLVKAHGIDIVGHLSKPIKPQELDRLIEEWERRSASTPRGLGRIYSTDEVLSAVRQGQIMNHYQPKVAVKSGEVVGVESLARWQHPVDGLVAPLRFIGVAEQGGVMEELTRVVFIRALNDMKELRGKGFHLTVSINLTVATLKAVEFADFALAEAERASISPADIMIELTESQLITDERGPLDVLTRLRLMRFKLSIDDFGTGYSSLAQLRNIPFDELKIDQSFVHRAAVDRTARAIYDASLGLAQQLGIKTVAEGVEDKADWDLVRSTECDAAQGYFIARPMAPQALAGWMEGWRERTKAKFTA